MFSCAHQQIHCSLLHRYCVRTPHISMVCTHQKCIMLWTPTNSLCMAAEMCRTYRTHTVRTHYECVLLCPPTKALCIAAEMCSTYSTHMVCTHQKCVLLWPPTNPLRIGAEMCCTYSTHMYGPYTLEMCSVVATNKSIVHCCRDVPYVQHT